MTDAERVTELEIRLAYLEDTMASLDAVITRQGNDIETLRKVNTTLAERLKALNERLEEIKVPDHEPPPPHY